MISAIKLKKRVADANILGIIISKLYRKKEPCSIILLKIDKSLKVGIYYAILLFNLIVCLWVKGNKKFPLNAKKIA